MKSLALPSVAARTWRGLRPWRDTRLAAITAAAQRMAEGDLSTPVPSPGRGELGALSAALEGVRESMFRIICRVRAGTASVASTSAALKSDNTALAARTDSQASSLEETASAMEQLSSIVRQNADNARDANAMMARTRESAARGSAAVAGVVESMEAIRERSARVAEIIAVIDGIAFQTNVLALNAAVEAARAGEQGRGFAVVAGEVRTLAQRAATAAKEVRTLITDSVQRVEQGGERVGAAGKAMDEILENVTRVTALVGDIASATQEQSTGIDEINRAVMQIDNATQQNASLVQDVARTAAGLQVEAEQLSRSVGGFMLGEREFGNADEAVALVRAGVAYAREQGLQSLVDEVNRLSDGRFVDRDLYLSVYAPDGVTAAHGTTRRLLDSDWRGHKDTDGKRFVVDMVQLANTRGNGWIDYKWVHPLSRKVLVKSAYFEKCGNVVVACGYYRR
jgi:methyl-accepting chemotaxis protein